MIPSQGKANGSDRFFHGGLGNISSTSILLEPIVFGDIVSRSWKEDNRNRIENL